MSRLADKENEKALAPDRCDYGEAKGESHACHARFPRCADCGDDLGCARCRGQEMIVKCKNCGMTRNMMPWYRDRQKPVKEHNRLAVPGTIRFTPSGFPMVVEGDGWLRPVRVDALPLRRKVTVSATGAYLDGDGQLLYPEEWQWLL